MEDFQEIFLDVLVVIVILYVCTFEFHINLGITVFVLIGAITALAYIFNSQKEEKR